jgi:hypothetical protein
VPIPGTYSLHFQSRRVTQISEIHSFHIRYHVNRLATYIYKCESNHKITDKLEPKKHGKLTETHRQKDRKSGYGWSCFRTSYSFKQACVVEKITFPPYACIIWRDYGWRSTYTVRWLIKVHAYGSSDIELSGVDAECFKRSWTPIADDMFSTKIPDRWFQIWWEFRTSVPQSVRVCKLMSNAVRQTSGRVSTRENNE